MRYLPRVRSRWLDIGQVLSFGVFLNRDEVEVHKYTKKEQGQYPAILIKQAWSIKNLLYGQKITPKNFAFAGTKWKILSGKLGPSCPLG